MVVDYSKWDKLELSDDSDIEVHPNVDKQSFVRMRQRQIHEKREQNKHNMKQLEISLEMNNGLVVRIQQMIDADKPEALLDVSQAVAISERGFELKKQPQSEVNPDGPKYNDMIESLMDKIDDDIKKEKTDADKVTAVISQLKGHQAKLREIIADQRKQYDELAEEQSKHISSDDIHTGFDSTIVSKANDESSSKASSSGKTAKETEIEVLNPDAEQLSGSSSSSTTAAAKPSSSNEEPECSKEALEYLQIPKGQMEKCFAFLQQHPKLLREEEKDGMLLVGFQQQLEGKTEQMKHTVYNAKIVEYCLTLGPDGTRKFFSKAMEKDPRVLDGLQKDVDLVVNHIIERCKVIAAEREADTQPEEQIQLHAVDPNTEISVTLPDESDSEAMAVYNTFSQEMRDAIASKQLDEINKVLANMTVEDAEDMVQKFDQCGVLQVEEKIYDATEWQKKKEEEAQPAE